MGGPHPTATSHSTHVTEFSQRTPPYALPMETVWTRMCATVQVIGWVEMAPCHGRVMEFSPQTPRSVAAVASAMPRTSVTVSMGTQDPRVMIGHVSASMSPIPSSATEEPIRARHQIPAYATNQTTMDPTARSLTAMGCSTATLTGSAHPQIHALAMMDGTPRLARTRSAHLPVITEIAPT